MGKYILLGLVFLISKGENTLSIVTLTESKFKVTID